MRSKTAELSRAMQPRWRRRLSTVLSLLLSVVVVLLLSSLSAPVTHVAFANPAGGTLPVIHWDASMIYAGQNNGYPWGPVGENTIVHGANFNPNEQLHLILAPGDSNSNSAVCRQPTVTVLVATVTADTTGGFTQSFPWPSAAGQVNQPYSICSLRMSNNTVASYLDDGPFTVLSSSPPLIALSASSVAAGNAITVTGHYWVPPQPVSVIIASCADCGGAVLVANTGANSTGLNSGSFSVSIPIPATAKPGDYVVNALTTTGLDANYTSGVKHLAITAAPTTQPSPTPTPTLQPSPTSSPTVTATATTAASATPAASATSNGASGTVTTTSNGSGGTTGTGTSSGNSNGGILFALICIAIAFFMIAAVILIMILLRRRRAAYVAKYPSYRSLSQTVQFGQSGQYGQSSPANYPLPYAQPAPIPAGNFTPSPSMPPQSFNSMPTESYNAPRVSITQNGGTQNAQYGQSPNLPTCPNCGRPLVPNLPACGVCGMPLSAMRR